MRMLKVIFGRLKWTCDTRVIHFDYALEQIKHGRKRNVHLEMGNLKQTELQRLKTEERKAEDKTRKIKKENHKKQRLATLKRLKRGNDNELRRNLLEKVVAGKQLRLAVETEEERRARLENDAATKRLRLAMEMDERKARLEKMLALIKGVVNVGMVCPSNPF